MEELLSLLRERFRLVQGLGEYPLLTQALMRARLKIDRAIRTADARESGEIHFSPDFMGRLKPGEIRWVLLHEGIHLLLDHPRRLVPLRRQVREAARIQAQRAREDRAPAGWDPDQWAAWRAVWAAALPGPDPWDLWARVAIGAWEEGLNQALDLVIHAWMLLLALPPGLADPPPGLFYPPEPEIPQLLRRSMEELGQMVWERVSRAMPEPDPGAEPSPSKEFRQTSLEEVLRQLDRIPLRGADENAADAGPEGEPEEGEAAEGEAPSGGEPMPDPFLDEGLRRAVQGEILRKAVQAGRLPGDLAETIMPGAGGQVPWFRILRQQLLEWLGEKRQYEWIRPSRRGLPSGLHLPRRRATGGEVLVLIRDTSGSMSPEVLEKVSGEILALLREGNLSGALLLDVDAGVQGGVFVQTNPDLWPPAGVRVVHDRKAVVEFLGTARGRGGTRFGPAFERVRELQKRGLPVSAVIYFTDGEGEFPDPSLDPGVPVWWIVPDRIAPPFGEVIVAPGLWAPRQEK